MLALTLPGDAWAEADWQTSDPARFALMFARAERCLCFIEFSDADVDKNDQDFRNMFTKGRHRGHRVFAIAQRHTQIPPIIREQWGQFWLFSCGFSVAKHFADDWGDEDILEAVKYPPHRYLFKRRCLPIQRG